MRIGTAISLLALLSASLAFLPPEAGAEEPDLDRALLEAGRSDIALDRRLEAVARVLAADAAVDPEAAVRAAVSLLAAAPEPACWLLLRAANDGWIPAGDRTRATDAITARLEADPGADAPLLHAANMLLGRRLGDVDETFTRTWPPHAFVRAVLTQEIGGLTTADGKPVLDAGPEAVHATLQVSAPIATLLDQAVSDDPATMRKGLDALVALGKRAVPLLLAEARHGAGARPDGRMPRAVRAILALGMIGDRRATPVLAGCLGSTNGWVRVTAASALGDLGDPAGAVPLAVHLATPGDLHRARDSWDHPGASATAVSEADWPNVEYYVIDCAAADALLRLGVPRAAGYLIHEKLDPSKGNFRIRVFQDAVDALRRALSDAPVAAYNVDGGLPQRDAAFIDLARWWHAQRDDAYLLARTLDETDPGFRKAARALVDRLTGKDVRQFMITKPACELLGRAITPTLIEALKTATRGAGRTEIARALALVRDERAIPPLLALLKDELPFVRAAAAEALGAYAREPQVVAALIATLKDRKEGPRVSAVAGLLGAPPTQEVLEAVRAATPKQPNPAHAMGLAVLLLVQEGDAHWPAVEKGLNARHRYERESWWGLLRRALDLPGYMHDAAAAPEAKQVRRLTKEQVSEARAAMSERGRRKQ